MGSKCVLTQLLNCAVRCIRFYDASAACMSICAIGQLHVHTQLHIPGLLCHVTPCLPSYTHVQLTVLLEGLSLLRVSHHMVTAHVLRLFLVALRQGPAGARLDPTPARKSGPLSWCEEVAAIAAMTRILQQHHTQRTVRAFLSAVDRALASQGSELNRQVGVDGFTDERSGLQREAWRAQQPCSASPMLCDRQGAVQLLYVLEVYVNACICVSAPHTPLWMRHVLACVPVECFTLQELLHVHSRLFLTHGDSPLQAAKSCGSELQWVLRSHSLRIVHTLSRALHDPAAPSQLMHSMGEESAGVLGMPPPHSAGQQRSTGATPNMRLSENMRCTALHCVVLRKLWLGEEATERAANEDLSCVETGCELSLLRFLCPSNPTLAFYQMTRQYCWELCSRSWEWWLRVLEVSKMRADSTATLRVNGEAFSPVSAGKATGTMAMTVREATLRSVALLQLVHGRYTRITNCGKASSSAPVRPSTFVKDVRRDAFCARSIDVSVRLLCDALPLCCLPTCSLLPCAPEPETWTLLSLLLTIETPPLLVEGIGFYEWLQEQLQQSATLAKESCVECAVTLCRHFHRVHDAALSSLASSWCAYCSHGHLYTSLDVPRMCARFSPSSAVKKLRVHWIIAESIDSYLHDGSSKSDARGLVHRPFCHIDEACCVSAWRALVASTVTILANRPVRWETEGVAGECMTPTNTPSDIGDVAVTLLCVLATTQRHKSRRLTSSMPSLFEVLCQSLLPEMLCNAVEGVVLERGMSFRRFKCHDAPTTKPSPSSNGEDKRDSNDVGASALHWRVRMWWVAARAHAGPSSPIEDALQQIVWGAFTDEAAWHVIATSRANASAPQLNGWLYRLLKLYVRSYLRSVSQSLPAHLTDSTETSSAETEGDTPLGHFDFADAAALSQAFRYGSSSLFSCSPAEELSITASPVVPDLKQERAALLLGTSFVPAGSLADTIMSNVECLWKGRTAVGGFLAEGTLREANNGNPQRRSSSSFTVPALWTAPTDQWHRDERVIFLTGSANISDTIEHQKKSSIPSTGTASVAGNQKPSSGVHCGTSAGREGPFVGRTCAKHTCILSDLVEHLNLLRRAVCRLAACDGGASLLQRGSTSLHRRRERCDTGAGDTTHGELGRATGSVLKELRPLLWSLSCLALRVCVAEDHGSARHLSLGTWERAVEVAVLGGIVQCRRAEANVIGRYNTAARDACVSTVTADERSTFSLLLPLLWRTLHYPNTLDGGHDAHHASSDICGTGDVPDAVLVVWRLQVFVGEWWRHLPLDPAHMPAQMRLLACLRAALLEPGTITIAEDDEVAWMLHRGVRELEANVRGGQCVDTEARNTMQMQPFRYLCDVLASIGEVTQQKRRARAPDVDARIRQCTRGGITTTRTGSNGRCAKEDFSDLSPIEIYVQALLPLHPYFASSTSLWSDVQAVPELDLLACTWLHVVAVYSICTYHPRLFLSSGRVSHKDGKSVNGAQQGPLSCVELLDAAHGTLSSLEHQLRHLSAGTPVRETATPAWKRRQLLCLCLSNELKTALSAMRVLMAASPTP